MANGYAKEIQNRIGAAPDGTIFIVSCANILSWHLFHDKIERKTVLGCKNLLQGGC